MSSRYADPEALVAKILRRSIRTVEGCWQWTGAKNQGGYGLVSDGHGRNIVVHRAVVMVRDGEVPDGSVIDHTCHDSYVCKQKPCPHRSCVNPEHLQVTTAQANTARMFERGLCHNGGHPLVPMGSSGTRYCPTCRANRRRRQSEDVAA